MSAWLIFLIPCVLITYVLLQLVGNPPILIASTMLIFLPSASTISTASQVNITKGTFIKPSIQSPSKVPLPPPPDAPRSLGGRSLRRVHAPRLPLVSPHVDPQRLFEVGGIAAARAFEGALSGVDLHVSDQPPLLREALITELTEVFVPGLPALLALQQSVAGHQEGHGAHLKDTRVTRHFYLGVSTAGRPAVTGCPQCQASRGVC